MKRIVGPVFTLVLVLAAFSVGFLIARQPADPQSSLRPNSEVMATNTRRANAVAQAATSTAAPSTPLATLTPSRTLKPPPTLEPPTATVQASETPIPTATATLDLSVNIPGLRGAETATPTGVVACVPRKDWKLEYEIQRGDALATIAQKFDIYVSDLVKGNCLTNPNVIVIGQKIKVPGDSLPVVPAVACVPYEVFTPFDGTTNVPGGGQLVFNWRGPRSPKTLLRITRPDGSKFESVVELRQNETVDAYKDLWPAGTYHWQLYPLDEGYRQDCPESPVYSFTKEVGPTATPTMATGGNVGP